MEIDFSAQIKNLNLKSQKVVLDTFFPSDGLKKVLEAKASEFNEKSDKSVTIDDLLKICANSLDRSKNFFRPGLQDEYFAVASITRFLKSGQEPATLAELSDLEISLARIDIARNKLEKCDFLCAKAPPFVKEDEKSDCSCEKPKADQKKEGSCAECGKKMPAKKEEK